MSRAIQLILLTVTIASWSAIAPSQAAGSDLPLNRSIAFTKNDGQWDSRVLFKADCQTMILWLTTQGTYYQFLKSTNSVAHDSCRRIKLGFAQAAICTPEVFEQFAVRMTIEGGDTSAVFRGENELGFKSNYLLGNDPSNWRTRVPSYSSVVVADVYPGIDLKYYSSDNGSLEYDFIVSPEADYRQILVKYHGLESIAISPSHDLLLETKWNTITELSPRIYQQAQGSLRHVSGSFKLSSDGVVSFALGADYDPTLSVTIDPTVVYSTYLGGSAYDGGFGIAVDTLGSAYVTGTTRSTDFPSEGTVHANPMNPDIFVAKLAPDGSSLEYSTVIGGNDYDEGRSIAVDAAGCAYVCGNSFSPNFPIRNGFQSTLKFFDGVFFKLSSLGDSLIFSSYLGGAATDDLKDIAVDQLGQIYLIGSTNSTDIPLLNPFQSSHANPAKGDVFILKMAATGDELIYGTYFGGTNWEWGGSIAVDPQGHIVVAGVTESADFPTKNPIQSYTRALDSYVAKFSVAGDSLIFSTLIGGFNGDDEAHGLAVDSAGCAYIGGTTSSADFPQKNPFQTHYVGEDAFVTKISKYGDSLIYSTCVGGTGGDQALAMALVGDKAILVGFTQSADFPVKEPFQASGPAWAFVTEMSSGGNSLEFSTRLGGTYRAWELAYAVAADNNGNVYVSGHTTSIDFPTIGPIQEYAGEFDAFVTKLTPGFVCGDVDASQQVILGDIIYVLNYVFAQGPQPNPIVAGDADCNGIVTISDAVYLINYIFSGGPAPCASC